MHLFDGFLWRALRWMPLAPPAPWLDDMPAPTSGSVGVDWAWRLASQRGVACSRVPAILPDASVLGAGMHPMLKCFYERTGDFTFTMQGGFGRVIGLWQRWFGERWDQLQLPDAEEREVSARVYDVEGESGRVWMVQDEQGRAIFVGRLDVVDLPGQGPHIRIACPVPGGTWLVLYRVQLRDGGLEYAANGEPGGAGHYMVPRKGPARYLGFLRERVCMVAGNGGLEVLHTFDANHMRVLTFRYAMRLRAGVMKGCREAAALEEGGRRARRAAAR